MLNPWRSEQAEWRWRNPMDVRSGEVIRYGQRVGKVLRSKQTVGGIEFVTHHPSKGPGSTKVITVPFFDDVEVSA